MSARTCDRPASTVFGDPSPPATAASLWSSSRAGATARGHLEVAMAPRARAPFESGVTLGDSCWGPIAAVGSVAPRGPGVASARAGSEAGSLRWRRCRGCSRADRIAAPRRVRGGGRAWCQQLGCQTRQGGHCDGRFWRNDPAFVLFLPSVRFNRKLVPFQDAF